MDYSQFLLAPDTAVQTYSLVFLLGSLTVSSLSDLKRMAAQTDFAQVWAAFAVIMFAADSYFGLTGQMHLAAFLLKWALIAAFAVAASSAHLMSISTMDAAALIALLSCGGPAHIVVALTLTLLVNELLKPVLKGYGEAGAYPYLPTVLVVNVLILLIIMAGGLEPILAAA